MRGDAHTQLLTEGASVVQGALPQELVERLRPFCRAEVDKHNCRASGNMKDSPAAPVYPTVPLYKEVIDAGFRILADMGFKDVRWLAGALIPKWQGEGRRGYHIDWWGWESTIDTWRADPPQIGILFYLDDATPETGSLIFVPQSHRREVPGGMHAWESWEPFHGESVLTAKAGDAVMLDPRALHATSPNTTVPIRHCLTMWYLIDYDKLEERTRATTMLSVDSGHHRALGAGAPNYAGGAAWFPHCKKPQFPRTLERIEALGRNGGTDREIIGKAAQPGDDFLDGDTYKWYFGVGAAVAPVRILEFGNRWGYSLIALAKGAMWAGVVPKVLGIDAEVDGIVTNDIALANLRACIPVQDEYPLILKVNTQDRAATIAAANNRGCFEVVHIDGDHSPAGIQNELHVAAMFVHPNGCLLVDDCDTPHVREAAEALAASYGITPVMLPTIHNTALIDIRKRSRYA